jgi:ElaB/YqjD/DUF883 family membrane-anchored ribosome-binding protein
MSIPIDDTDTSYGGSATRATISDVRSDAAKVGTDVKHLARDSATVAKDTVVQSARDIAHRAETAHEKMCGYVKSNPTASVLIAIGAGAIIGRLFSR